MEEDNEELIELLKSLELRLKRRAVRAPLRSPEDLFEELSALNLVIELREKLER